MKAFDTAIGLKSDEAEWYIQRGVCKHDAGDEEASFLLSQGPRNVLAVMMPYRTSNPDSEGDARRVIEKLGIDVFAIVEQDMYPCEPDAPLPIAKRTQKYLGSCGIPAVTF